MMKIYATEFLFVLILSSCSAKNNDVAFGYIEKNDMAGLSKALESRLPPDSFNSKSGKTLLFYAVEKKNLGMVELLLNAKAGPNVLTKDGKSCLFAAYAYYKPESLALLSLLLDRGADANHQERGTTLLFSAVETCNYDLAKLLLDHGANPAIPDSHGYLPIQSIGGPFGCEAKESAQLEKLLEAHGSKTPDSLKKQ